MLTCKECIERMKPDDPRVPDGRYHHSACDYFCGKPTYYRELEVIPELGKIIPWSGRQWDKVQQIGSEVRGWRQKHAEMMVSLEKLNKKQTETKYD